MISYIKMILFLGFTKEMRLEMNLEWRISFTRAEHILLKSLNQPKLRAYLFSLLLYRIFLAPLNSIDEEHVRYSIVVIKLTFQMT